jgi:hypothetical protein
MRVLDETSDNMRWIKKLMFKNMKVTVDIIVLFSQYVKPRCQLSSVTGFGKTVLRHETKHNFNWLLMKFIPTRQKLLNTALFIAHSSILVATQNGWLHLCTRLPLHALMTDKTASLSNSFHILLLEKPSFFLAFCLSWSSNEAVPSSYMLIGFKKI